MKRQTMLDAFAANAKALGWTGVSTSDEGGTVTVLLSAEGAAEQILEGPLNKLPSLLKTLGGPEDYPAIEEYDTQADPTPTAELAAELAEMPPVDSAAVKAELDDAIARLAAEEAVCPWPREASAEIQVGTWLVRGVGWKCGPFSREFGDGTEAEAFAKKCRRAAKSPKYAKTIQVAQVQCSAS